MNPYEFEHLIAEIWELQGYQTTVRSGSGDRGIDVEATKTTPFEQQVLIQAKRYGADNKVGSAEIRNYATLYQQVPETDTVVLVTTSSFTSEAKSLARDLGVKAVDGEAFAELVQDHYQDLESFSIETGWDESISDSASTEPEDPLKDGADSGLSGTPEEIRSKLAETLENVINGEGKVTIKWYNNQYEGVEYFEVVYGTKGLIFKKFGANIMTSKKYQKSSFEGIDEIDKIRNIWDTQTDLYIWKSGKDEVQPELDVMLEFMRRTGSNENDILDITLEEGKYMFS